MCALDSFSSSISSVTSWFFQLYFLMNHRSGLSENVHARYGLVSQLCPTLCDPMDCSLPGSSVHGIIQARMLEWVAIPFPGDLPDPGIKPRSLALQAGSLPSEPLGSHPWVRKIPYGREWLPTPAFLPG